MELSFNAVEALERSRPSCTIFPNLVSLSLDSRYMRKIFMAPSVRTLTWTLDSSMRVGLALPTACQSIVDRMPNVTSLHLRFEDVLNLQNSLGDLCAGLSSLQTVSMPLYGYVPSILNRLSGLRCLRSITFEHRQHDEMLTYPPTMAVNHFDPSSFDLHHTPFPALRTLCFAAPGLRQALSFLIGTTFPIASLTTLVIRVPFLRGVHAKFVSDAITRLSTSAFSLQELTLWLTPYAGHASPTGASIPAVTIDDLRPVRHFVFLRAFIIHHPVPITGTTSDMESFASSLPRIERLHLNHHPSISNPSKFCISTLESFARHCPRLQDLGVYIDGRRKPEGSANVVFTAVLRDVRFGRSPFPGMRSGGLCLVLAQYISHLFPPSTSISGVLSDNTLDSKDFVPSFGSTTVNDNRPALDEFMDVRVREMVSLAASLREFRLWTRVPCVRIEQEIQTLKALKRGQSRYPFIF